MQLLTLGLSQQLRGRDRKTPPLDPTNHQAERHSSPRIYTGKGIGPPLSKKQSKAVLIVSSKVRGACCTLLNPQLPDSETCQSSLTDSS